jgi:DNA-directed RNA polymerase specialized sigma subunit
MRSLVDPKWAVEHPYSTDDPDRPWRRKHLAPMYARYKPSRQDVRDALQEILGSVLTEREQEVVRLLVDEGLSLQATADALGLHAKSHIYRTRERAFAKLRAAISNDPILKEINGINN